MGRIWALCLILGTACAPESQSGGTAPMAMSLTSSAFKNNGDIPADHTCQGQDTSPALDISGVPDKTQSLVLIVDDPDAPDPQAPTMTWVHWVIYNLPPDTTGLLEGVTTLPEGARLGQNDFKKTSYGGPCPPVGRHRYFFKLYALDTVLNLTKPATKDLVEQAMQGHILAETTLVGTYQKH